MWQGSLVFCRGITVGRTSLMRSGDRVDALEPQNELCTQYTFNMIPQEQALVRLVIVIL
jgi:hypothetical protein